MAESEQPEQKPANPNNTMQRGAFAVCAILIIGIGYLKKAESLDTFIEDADRFPGWKGELPVSEPAIHDSVGFGELGKVSLLGFPAHQARDLGAHPPLHPTPPTLRKYGVAK